MEPPPPNFFEVNVTHIHSSINKDAHLSFKPNTPQSCDGLRNFFEAQRKDPSNNFVGEVKQLITKHDLPSFGGYTILSYNLDYTIIPTRKLK